MNPLLINLTLCCFALAADLRIASWNMANRPNNADHDGHLSTILDAVDVDILSMSETDAGSAEQTAEIFNEVSGRSVVTEPDGGGDRTGFVYDCSSVSLLSTKDLSDGLTHNTLRGEFRPFGTSGAADFFMYSIHLKSGGGSADRALRSDEAKIIVDDAQSLGPDVHVIYGGDFNWQNASEDAWDVFTSVAFDAFDPGNVLGAGAWRDNEEFRELHTQNPGASMDDRFDMHFVTAEFLDGAGIDLIEGSYTVFGNDGTHNLNEPITSGTGAAADVLTALASFSDHLPVMSDFTVADVVIGDIDDDGTVGFSDFLTLSRNFGLSDRCAIHGELDGDGAVGFSDFLVLAREFGNASGTTQVPEGAFGFRIILVGCLLIWRRWLVSESYAGAS